MDTFQEMGLLPEILKALDDLGFETPTLIQKKAIPFVIAEPRDLKAFAQTGTGKTAAFSLPIIQQIDIPNRKTQALIMCPTRELCLQITRDIKNYTKYLKEFSTVAVYGGESMEKQVRALRKGAQIVVGTPGRLKDLISRKKLKIDAIEWLVLDEADEMLNMGFKDDLDAILSSTPDEKQTLLFSATMPKEVDRIARTYMTDAEEITAGTRNKGADKVEHYYYMVQARDRYNALRRIADITPNIYGIVFCRTRMETKMVSDKLMEDNYSADALHGDLSQQQRDYVMQRFRNKKIQILVATDVAARGIDIDDLTHVINYNLPDNIESYTHRSGRTGRAGKDGISLAIIHLREMNRIRAIERRIGKKFEKKEVPGGKEICEMRLLHLIDKVEKTEVNEEQIESFMTDIYAKLEAFSKEELIKKFVSLEFDRFLKFYKNAPNLNVSDKGGRDRGDRGGRDRGRDRDRGRGEEQKFARFHINLGNKHNMNPGALISLLNRTMKRSKFQIGKIEILKNFSFFEVEYGWEAEIVRLMSKATYEGQDVTVEVTKSPPKSSGGGDRGGDRGGSRSGGGGNRRNFRGGGYPKKGGKRTRKRFRD